MKKLVKKNIGQITGEENVLKSPIFVEAFENICNIYEPQHEYAVFSLCTQTKPFSSSMKWKGIIKIFEGIADLIVCSSAGVIPIEYENCYPFNNYDSHSGHEGAENLSNYSKSLFEYRLKTFLTTFKYKKVVFLLDPYEGASDVVRHLGMNNVRQFPSPAIWNSITEEDFIGYSLRFCKVLNKRCILEVQDWLGIEIPYLKSQKFARKSSLFQVMEEIYDNKLKANIGYTKSDLKAIISQYGKYDKTYVYKCIEGNVVGTKDYKFYIKNNEYFIKVGKLYYKNTGSPVINKKKLF